METKQKKKEEPKAKLLCKQCEKGHDAEKGIKLKRCSACMSTWYCSEECQRADRKVHRLICQKPTEKGSEKLEDLKPDTVTMFNYAPKKNTRNSDHEWIHKNLNIFLHAQETSKSLGKNNERGLVLCDYPDLKQPVVWISQEQAERFRSDQDSNAPKLNIFNAKVFQMMKEYDPTKQMILVLKKFDNRYMSDGTPIDIYSSYRMSIVRRTTPQ